MEKIGLTAVALAALFLSGNALAEGKPDFADADADGDGKISIQEAKEAGIPEAEAKREDVDKDGALTEKDWTYVEKDPQPSSGEGVGPPEGQPGGGQPGGGQPGGGQPGGGQPGGGQPGGGQPGGGQPGGGQPGGGQPGGGQPGGGDSQPGM